MKSILLTHTLIVSFASGLMLPRSPALRRPTTTTTSLFETISDPEAKVTIRDGVPPQRPKWDMSGSEIDYDGKKKNNIMNGMFLAKKRKPGEGKPKKNTRKNKKSRFSFTKADNVIDVSPTSSAIVEQFERDDSTPAFILDDFEHRNQDVFAPLSSGRKVTVHQVIVVVHAALCFYQLVTTAGALWKRSNMNALLISMAGTSSLATQPLVRDWALVSSSLALRQPHRFITSAFVEGNALTFCLKHQSLKRMPSYMESYLGPSVYATTFLCSLLVGSWTHVMFGTGVAQGMTSGLAGLYGLWASTICFGLKRLRESTNAPMMIATGMGQLFLMALSLPRVSGWSQFGGFVTGGLLGSLFVHQTQNAPPQRTKNLLKAVWMVAGVAMLLSPTWRQAPSLFVQSLWSPGSLTRGGRFYG